MLYEHLGVFFLFRMGGLKDFCNHSYTLATALKIHFVLLKTKSCFASLSIVIDNQFLAK
jgi:hypothetical protein